MNRIIAGTLGILGCAGFVALADQVEMQNGDRYNGKVLSLNADTLVLQSQVAGTLKLPRGSISRLTLGPVSASSTSNNSTGKLPPQPVQGALTNSETAAALRSLAGSTNHALGQTPMQLVEGAGPEAKAMFNQLMSGLLSGKLDAKDIRNQAKAVATQARELRGELGDEAAPLLDAYLAILDKFVAEAPADDAAPAPKAPGPLKQN